MLQKIKTPLGEMIAFANSEGLCLLKFTDSAQVAQLLAEVQTIGTSDHRYDPQTILKQTQIQVIEYFNQSRKTFTLPINCYGSPFQQAAWNILKKIPYGTTISYQEQAIALNKPTAYRAVGTANGRNKMELIIPCHRVIKKNNRLAGYAGKIWRKEYLLTLEKTVN